MRLCENRQKPERQPKPWEVSRHSVPAGTKAVPNDPKCSTTLSLEISLTLKPLALGFEKKYTIFSSINLFHVIPYFKYTGNSCQTSFNITAMQQLTNDEGISKTIIYKISTQFQIGFNLPPKMIELSAFSFVIKKTGHDCADHKSARSHCSVDFRTSCSPR
jgi:hypothetical protein